MESNLESELPSVLRELRSQLETIARFLRPGQMTPAPVIQMLTHTAKTLETLTPKVDAWMAAISEERSQRRAAAARGAIRKAYRPSRRRR